MLLLTRADEAGGRTARRTGGRERTRIAVPSQVRGVVPEFLDEVPYGILGRLDRAAVMQPKPEHTTNILRWIALNGARDRDETIKACTTENAAWFQPWSTVKLYDRSLRLPADEVAMFVLEEPVHVPGDPPAVILERWLLALQQYPQAKLLYLEPFFDAPAEATAKALTAVELRRAVNEHWDRLFRSARRWSPLFKFERGVMNWLERRQRRQELRLQSEQYLARLREREEVTKALKPVPETEPRVRVDLDRRLQERRRAREAAAAEVWMRQQSQALPMDLRRQLEEIEEDVARLGPELLRRGPIAHDTASRTLSRREFNVAVMMGTIVFPVHRYRRYDPLAALELPGEPNKLRLIGHWDQWMAAVDGKMQMCTFTHI